MKKSRKFISMPIVSLEEGIQIGSVRNLVVDPAKQDIAAIIVDQRRWFREQKIIPYAKVRSIGNDAITIDQSANVQKSVSLPQILKLMKENINPIGARVITESGTVLGEVDEYYIDEETGKILQLEISGKLLESLFKGKGLMSAEYIRTFGSKIIVVRDGTEEKLEKLDGGLNETIHTIKENTTNLWESTKKQTKKISKNLKDKYEKKSKDEKTAVEEPAPEPDPNMDITGEVEIKNEEVLNEISDTSQTLDEPGTENEPEQPKGV
ncbi:MAG: photosystem reaction center subunit H [Firmicutes bacterium HGW-Firmicutes-14]|nr:MAG: photosystem reaction center subunit H [Firmicutes bacterium HGW-Firmicutes-14]